jgi:hypothetical protein
MCPISHADGHDLPGLIDEFVPGIAAMSDNIIVGREDAAGQPIVAHELPDVFHWVEFGRARRQGDDSDVAGYLEFSGGVSSILIHDENRMGVGVTAMGISVMCRLTSP